MDETIRRDESSEGYTRGTPARTEDARRDDTLLLLRHRERTKQQLTKREREERWPIG